METSFEWFEVFAGNIEAVQVDQWTTESVWIGGRVQRRQGEDWGFFPSRDEAVRFVIACVERVLERHRSAAAYTEERLVRLRATHRVAA